MTKGELLLLIKEGVYEFELPDDDESIELLDECFRDGLIYSEPTRISEFFFLSPAGQKALPS